MIRNKILFTIFFLVHSFLSLSQDQIIQMESKERSLESVLQYLESNHDFLSSYKEKDVKNVVVVTPNKPFTINIFLEKILASTNLEFKIIEEKYIIISKRNGSQETINSENSELSTLCGRVVSSLSSDPLSFANIYLPKTQDGTSANENGDFQIQTKIDFQDTIVISYVGFQEKKIIVRELLQNPCLTISLDLIEYSEDFVIVLDYLTDGVALNDNGEFANLKPNRIGVLPGQAEPDVLKTIQFLPGISSPENSPSSIHIRGGTPDQNLILWEDIPIYHSAHYFGMISAFNPFIINDTKVFRGGFNAEYGGRISGVIDMRSDNNIPTRNNVTIGSNLINAYANGKFTLLKNKASVVFSLRRSITDLWESPTFNDITQRIQQGVLYQIPDLNTTPLDIRFNNNFNFFDSNLKGLFKISEKDKISVATFYGNNDFQSKIFDDNVQRNQNDSLYLTNMGASLTWTHQWNSRFSTKLLGVISDFQYDYEYRVRTQSQNDNDKSGIKKSSINEKQFHFKGIYQLPRNQLLKVGYQLSDYDVSFQITKESRNNKQANQNKKYQSLLHVLYGTWNTNPNKRWGLKAGVRASYYEEEDGTYLEPRVRLWYQLFNGLNVYLNSGKYYQFLSQLVELEGDRASIQTPVWVLTGDEEVPILSSTQHQLGFLFEKNNWILDVQGYSKNINGLTSLATGFNENLSNRFHIGEAKIMGLDILLKRRWKNFRSWISYSNGKVEHQFDTFLDKNFLSSYDQTFVLSWVNMLKYKNWEFSLGWKYSSGTPYSQRQNFRIETNGMGSDSESNIEAVINEFNSGRLEPLHHLDASFLYSFTSKKERWKGVVGMSLFNIYNQKNTYQRGLYIDDPLNAAAELKYLDKVDIGFMPNFVVRVEW